MKLTVKKIAEAVSGQWRGNGALVIRGAAGLSEARPGDITFLRDLKNIKLLQGTRAGAIFVPKGLPLNGERRTVVEVESPIAAFSWVLEQMAKERRPPRPAGVHKLAFVEKSAKIGKNASVGPFCIVEEKAEIEDGVRLESQVYVGARAKIGKGTLIYPQVVIREDVKIGQRCIIHAGVVLGSDGYGFYFAKGKHNKIPQVGTVTIEDDVEIGSCTTIDRATTGTTIIRKGAKIDNLVQVAHNVDVGEHSLLVAQVGIAGSAKIGKGVVVGGQAGVGDHVTVGEGSRIGGQSGVKQDVPPGSVLWGTPTQPLQDVLRQYVLLKRLPELFKDVKKLKDKNDS